MGVEEATHAGLVEALHKIPCHSLPFTAMETDKVVTGYERERKKREREREKKREKRKIIIINLTRGGGALFHVSTGESGHFSSMSDAETEDLIRAAFVVVFWW